MAEAAKDILISLESEHAEKIFGGQKLVEFRRRNMRVPPGATVWIYVKLPVGSIVGRVKVEAVHSCSPATLWRRFGGVSGLSRQEFFDYFTGVARGFALVLHGAKRFRSSLTLESTRHVVRHFQPPQFFHWLSADHPLLPLMTARQ
jgi:predicted transcriptional regulator